MSDSRKAALRIAGSVVFVLGLLLFLVETRSTGQSVENLTVVLSPGAPSIIGAAMAVFAVAELVVLHFLGRRKTTTKHHLRHA